MTDFRVVSTGNDYEVALWCARDAHENLMSSRRGMHRIGSQNSRLLCLYDNNPYSFEPINGPKRMAETSAILEKINEIRIEILAVAWWPPEGKEGAGYTRAILMRTQQAVEDDLARAVKHILESSWKREPMYRGL